METSHFCEGIYFPSSSNQISTVNLRIQNATWLVRRKINVVYDNYYSCNKITTIVELERPVSTESVDVHMVLFKLKNNVLGDKLTTNVTIPKNQYIIEIYSFDFDDNISYHHKSTTAYQLVILIGMISISFLHSFKTDDNKSNVYSKSSKIVSAAVSSQMSEDFANLLDSDASSDFVLRCAGEEFSVHKCILAARSSVFAAMLRFHSKNAEAEKSRITNSVTSEAEDKSCQKQQKVQNCIQETSGASNQNEVSAEDIVDLKPEILRKVLKYIYSGQIDDLTGDVAGDLLYAADKYQLVLLKEICVKKLKSTLSASNVLDMLVIGDLHDQSLKAHAMDFICKYPSLSELKRMEKWASLQKTHPTMIIEVLTSVVGYLQDSKNFKK